MPTETDKTLSPDPRDSEITSLKKQLADLKAEHSELTEDRDEISDQLDAAQKQLSQRNAAPSGDHCVLGGKTYQVTGTVSCRFATEEGRRGNIDLEDELVILKR